MILAGLVLGTLGMVLMAGWFGGAFRAADRPTFVIEKPHLPQKWAPVAEALDRWREQGHLSREEHQRLSDLLREDVALSSNQNLP